MDPEQELREAQQRFTEAQKRWGADAPEYGLAEGAAPPEHNEAWKAVETAAQDLAEQHNRCAALYLGQSRYSLCRDALAKASAVLASKPLQRGGGRTEELQVAVLNTSACYNRRVRQPGPTRPAPPDPAARKCRARPS